MQQFLQLYGRMVVAAGISSSSRFWFKRLCIKAPMPSQTSVPVCIVDLGSFFQNECRPFCSSGCVNLEKEALLGGFQQTSTLDASRLELPDPVAPLVPRRPM